MGEVRFVYQADCGDCGWSADRLDHRPARCADCRSENIGWVGIEEIWSGLL